MKKKEDKNKDLASLQKELADLKNLFVTGYEKLKVSQDFELRKVVRKAGGKYRVIKNNLAELAGEGPAEPTGAEGSARDDVAGLYHGRSGGAGQGADGVRENQPLIHLQGRLGGRPGDRRQGYQRAGGDAFEGSDICQTALRDQRAGAATGDGNQCRRPQLGGGSRSGREGKQVLGVIWRRAAEFSGVQ